MATVPVQDPFSDPAAAVQKAVGWLVSRKISSPLLVDCGLNTTPGYLPDEHDTQVLRQEDAFADEGILRLSTNRVEITTERTYFQVYEGFEPLEIACPVCKVNLIEGMDLVDYHHESLEDKYQSILTRVDRAIDD